MGVALSQQVHLLVHPFKSCGFFFHVRELAFNFMNLVHDALLHNSSALSWKFLAFLVGLILSHFSHS